MNEKTSEAFERACAAIADDGHVELAAALRGLRDGYHGAREDDPDYSRAYRLGHDAGSLID